MKRAQGILEYSILLAILIAAMVVMQVYVKRSYQGRLKREADSVGQQYSPGHVTSNSNVTTISNSVLYTGGTTKVADMPGVVIGEAAIQKGVTVTVSNSTMSSNSREVIDSLGSETLYTKP